MEHLDPGELKLSRWGSTEDGTTFTRRVKPGQTLFGKRRAYQRKVAYAEFDAICSGDIYTFEADETQLLGGLLPFLVQSNRLLRAGSRHVSGFSVAAHQLARPQGLRVRPPTSRGAETHRRPPLGRREGPKGASWTTPCADLCPPGLAGSEGRRVHGWRNSQLFPDLGQVSRERILGRTSSRDHGTLCLVVVRSRTRGLPARKPEERA